MNVVHYSEEQLLDYALRNDRDDGQPHIQAHVSDCVECQSVVTEFHQFSLSLEDTAVWEAEDVASALARSDVHKVDQILSYANRLSTEKNQAALYAAQLLSIDPEARKDLIELSSEYWTIGLADYLCEKAYESNEPREALQYSELAIQISDRVPAEFYPVASISHARSRAWREHGLSLYYLGRHRESLASLDRADQHASHAAIAEFDLANNGYVRAQVLRDLDRLPEALRVTRNCAEVFTSFGHERRVLHCQLLEGAILYKTGDIRGAREIWIELLKPARASGEVATVGHLFHNIGNACLELGESDSAGTYLLQASLIFEDLGMRIEAVRTRWAIARIVLATDRIQEALVRLRQVQEQFETLEMVPEAGLVGLDIVESLLRLSQTDEAALICRYLVERFTAVGQDVNAITALSYLREALVAGKASPQLTRHVRSYISELPRRGQQQLFAPPPPD